MKCKKRTEVFSRVVGFFRPVQAWNAGKKEEFKDRKKMKIIEVQK
jgi:ribonucleoside-triphosphate reductase